VQLNGAACGDDDNASMNRRLTFYRLCDRLASRLQSLFVPLVGQIVKDVCRVLKQTNEGSKPRVICQFNPLKPTVAVWVQL